MHSSSKPPRLVFLLNSAQRRLQQWIGAQHSAQVEAGPETPSPAQAGLLFSLAKQDGATMSQLAMALDLVPSAISGLVQRMEALGWVQRHSCAQDARTQRVWLRPAGQAQLPGLQQAMKRINRELTRGFTEAELQTVARWLQHVQSLEAPTP